MFYKIIMYFLIGLLIGYILEFMYRSLTARKIIFPKFINYQMYGLTGGFLYFLYMLNISLISKLIYMFIFPTVIEFIIGYSYLKIYGIYLWDYSNEIFNFKKIICPAYSFVWFVISLIYYLLIIPLF